MTSSKQRPPGVPTSVFSLFSDARSSSQLRFLLATAVLSAGYLLWGGDAGVPATGKSAQATGLDSASSTQGAAPFGSNQGARPSRQQGLDAPGAPDPFSRSQEEQMNVKRTTERQKTIVADTTRLLQLAQELKVEVDKSTKNQLSVSVVKKAEDIEKLARIVKDKMKGF